MHEAIRTGTPWQNYPPTYRRVEIERLAGWIRVGASGAVLGLRGVGRSNLLGFLCHRADVLDTLIDPQRLHVALVPVDLGDLPTPALADFYRVLLRAIYEVHHHFPDGVREQIVQTYEEHRGETDAFVVQSALRELLYICQKRELRVVLVVDRFDAFARLLSPAMAHALGALRDTFRDTLLYIVGIRQSLTYLTDLELDDDLYRLLTTHLCHLGPLAGDDALYLIEQRTAAGSSAPAAREIETMLALSGGYPTLLQAICRWWLLEPTPPTHGWRSTLAAQPPMQHRLHSIWSGLTQEEQQLLTALVRRQTVAAANGAGPQHTAALDRLVERGICRRGGAGWSLFGELFVDFVAERGEMSRGRIWLEAQSERLFHGQTPLADLTPKEERVLRFLVQQPHARHAYTDVIVHGWSDEESYHGVSNDALFQVISGLRRKIEPQPTQPVYIVNWRGKPEGGYAFYPEGRPR